MKIYKKCPPKKNEAAVKAWKHFVAKNDATPHAMYKRPNCFKKKSERSKATGWGLWLAHYDDYIDYWDPGKAGEEFRNVYDFIAKQDILNNGITKTVKLILSCQTIKTSCFTLKMKVSLLAKR